MLEYARYEIACLAIAIGEQNIRIFTDYVEWLKNLFHSNAIPLEVLDKNFELFQAVLCAELNPETHTLLQQYFQAARDILACPVQHCESYIDPSSRYGVVAQQYLGAVLAGDRPLATELIVDTFAAGAAIEDIYINILEPVQNELGRLWLEGRISVGQEHFASGVTQLVMSQLYYPYICQTPKTLGTVIVCCAPGELHEIGARMFADLCELRGWHVVFMGANISS